MSYFVASVCDVHGKKRCWRRSTKFGPFIIYDDDGTVWRCSRCPPELISYGDARRRLADGGEDLVVEVEGHGLLPAAAGGVLGVPLLEVLRQVGAARPPQRLLRRPGLRVEMLPRAEQFRRRRGE